MFSDAHVVIRSQSDDDRDAGDENWTGAPPEGGTGYGWLDIVENKYAYKDEQILQRRRGGEESRRTVDAYGDNLCLWASLFLRTRELPSRELLHQPAVAVHLPYAARDLKQQLSASYNHGLERTITFETLTETTQ